MPPENRDAAYIWDMVDAARTIQDFTAGVSLADYLLDCKLQLAVERAIEIIGGEIKQDRIWLVATERIPELVAQLQPLLPPVDPSTNL